VTVKEKRKKVTGEQWVHQEVWDFTEIWIPFENKIKRGI